MMIELSIYKVIKMVGMDRSKVLDDLLNYTLENRQSNNSEKYGEWQGN